MTALDALARRASSLLRRIESAPGLACALWATWLSFEYFAFGPDSYLRIHDNGDSNIPAKLGLRWGFWQPQWLCGIDQLAAGVTSDADTVWLHAAPAWLAYAVVLWAQRFIAAYFLYRLLRDELELQPAACWFAALGYSLFFELPLNNGWAGFNLSDGIALPGIPLFAWSLGRLVRSRRRIRFVAAGALGLLLALWSSPVLALFVMPAIAVWLLMLAPPPAGRRALVPLCATMLAVWTTAELPQVLASLGLPESHRSTWQVISSLSRRWDGALEALALLRANLIPLALVALALALRSSVRRFLPLVLVSGAILLLVLFSVPIQLFLHDHAPPLANLQARRVSFSFPFLVTVAGAIALDSLSRSRRRVFAVVAALALAAVALRSGRVAQVMERKRHEGESFRVALRDPALKALAARTASDPPFRVATVATPWSAGPHPGFAWAYGFEAADGYVALYPLRYKQYWEGVAAPLFEREPATWSYFHEWGSRVYLFQPNDAASDGIDAGRNWDLRLLSLANVRFLFSAVPLRHRDLVEVAGLPPGRVRVYENRAVLPRFFLAHELRTAARPSLPAAMKAAESLAVTVFAEPRAAEPLERSLAASDDGVEIERYASDCIVLGSRAAAPAVLVATNSWAPGWRARIDGAPAPIFPADLAFQGVRLPAGRHKIRLSYAPEIPGLNGRRDPCD